MRRMNLAMVPFGGRPWGIRRSVGDAKEPPNGSCEHIRWRRRQDLEWCARTSNPPPSGARLGRRPLAYIFVL